MTVEPQKEHQWLQRLVGEWTFEVEMVAEPGKEPPEKHTGTETVRSLGGLWVICEGHGNTPEGPADSIMTLGYDPEKKRFQGTFVASTMTHLWLYESGELDPTGTALALDADGPSFTVAGQTSRYRDIIETKSDDHRLLRSTVLGDDGQWQTISVSTYRRKK